MDIAVVKRPYALTIVRVSLLVPEPTCSSGTLSRGTGGALLAFVNADRFAEFVNLAPVYIRAQAYLRAGSGQEAATEFQKFVDHAIINVLFPRHALAVLGLARAYSLMHDMARSKKAYEDFFRLWSEADPDIPVLVKARAEYAKLQ